MRTLAVTADPIANGRDAISAFKVKARDFKDANLPKAASAAEQAGKAISDFALSTSKSLAKSLRSQQTSTSGALLQSAGRFARRNPALLAAAGLTVAAIGYAAWRSRQEAKPADPIAAE